MTLLRCGFCNKLSKVERYAASDCGFRVASGECRSCNSLIVEQISPILGATPGAELVDPSDPQLIGLSTAGRFTASGFPS